MYLYKKLIQLVSYVCHVELASLWLDCWPNHVFYVEGIYYSALNWDAGSLRKWKEQLEYEHDRD